MNPKRISAAFAALSMLLLPFACEEEAGDEMGRAHKTVTDTVSVSLALSVSDTTFAFADGDSLSIFDSYGDAFRGDVADGRVSGSAGQDADCIFAAYPYNVANSFYDGLASVELPVVQQAVEGGYDRSAWLGFASLRGSSGTLAFKPAGARVAFSIPSDDISFVRLSGASGEKLAGRILAVLGTASQPSDTVILRSDSALGSSSVTLEGSLQMGKEYSIIVLPQTLAKGFDITLGKTDGSTASVKGSKEVALYAGRITRIGLDGTVPDPDVPVDPDETDLYAAYQAGKTITVCGVKYNKAVHGNAALVNASKNESLAWYFMNRTQKVIFFSADEGCYYYSGVVNVEGKSGLFGEHVAISRYTDKPVTWKFSNADGSAAGDSQFLRGGSFAFKNIIFDISPKTSGYTFGGNGDMGDVDAFHFDGCTFTGMGVSLFYTSGGKAQALRSIRMQNCKFLYTAATTNHIVFNIYQSSVLDRFEELVFENNVVCSPAYCKGFNTFASYAGSVSTGTVGALRMSVKNNIFYNAPAPKQLVKCAMTVSSAALDKNIFWSATDPHTADSGINGIYMFTLSDASQTAGALSIGDNLLYAPAGVHWYAVNSNQGAKLNPEGNELSRMAADPFESFDATAGTYVLKEDYAAYGPQ